MKFLLDANLPRRLPAVIQAAGHEAIDCRDIGMRYAKDPVIARYLLQQQLALITRDFDFADIRNYPPEEYNGLVVLDLPDTAVAEQICDRVSAFLAQDDIVKLLPRRLAIVEPDRVRLRPKPRKGPQ